MRFRAYLFDLDGTLIDHFAAIHRSHAHTRAKLGLPAPSLAEVRSAVGGGLENALVNLSPSADQAEALRIYRAYWDETMLDDVELMPGARELLEALHARKAVLGVITNKLGSSSRLICEHLGIAPFLQGVFGSKDTPWIKPQPEFTARVLERLGVVAGEALLVGDSPYDIQAAHNAGLPAWCVTTGTHDAAQLRAAKADGVFGDLAEIGRSLGL